MALPAGRYGVTKNQLLKIKKLPMNTIKLIEELTEKFDLLGTAAFKNSTSVVTQSTDLVESGAVKDIVGWGNKNLLPYNLSTIKATNTVGVWNGNTYTLNNLDFIVSADNVGNVEKITVNGTPSSATALILCPTQTYLGELIFSGCIGGSSSTYELLLMSSSSGDLHNYNGDTAISPQSDRTYQARILVKSSVSNITFYPMIRLTTITDATYEPYHASVEESLAEKADNSVIGTVEDGANASKAWSAGEHFIKDGQFKEVTQPIASGGAINDSNTTDKPIADCLVKQATFSGTTSNTGILTLSIPTGAHVLNVEITNVLTVIYRRASDPYLGVKCLNPSDMAVLSETAVSGTYYYID